MSGSNDQKSWYVISNDFVLHSMYNDEGTTFKKRLAFPLSDYAYFRLEIMDNAKNPINILKIGYEESKNSRGLMSRFNFRIDSQMDSADRSYIKLSLPEKMYFEKLHFQLTGADFYSRQASVYVNESIENSKNEKVIMKKWIRSFTLNSNSDNMFDIGQMRLDKLIVEIDNKDNQPLILTKVSGTYLKKYLILNLKAQTSYKLKFGNTDLRSPSYDIGYFKKQIPNKTQTAQVLNVRRLDREAKEAPEKSLFENVYLIWFVIGIVGLLLGWMSIKMIRELGRKDD